MTSENAETLVLPAPRERTKEKHAPRYHVILLDDDFHTYDYVERMLITLFRFSEQRAHSCACEVDKAGRVILLTTTREHAELKQDQIHSFGADPLLAESVGSMSAVVEPAE